MFILDIQKLLAGDVILTTGTSVQSKLIRKATESSFSHAILYVGGSSFIHSDSLGVHSGNLKRLLFDDQSQVVALRLNDSDEVQMANICMFARTQIGKQYSVPEAIRSKVKRNKKFKALSNRQFCSRLVAQAYAKAGICIVKNPDYCYPFDIARSPLMIRIENCIRTASSEEIEAAFSPNQITKQTTVINDFFKNVRTFTKIDIQSFKQLTSYLMVNPHHDHEISEILQNSGYLNLWEMDIEECPWNYDQTTFLALDESRSLKLELATLLKDGAINSLKIFIQMYKHHTELNQKRPLKYFLLNITLYTKLIELAQIRMATAEYVLAHA